MLRSSLACTGGWHQAFCLSRSKLERAPEQDLLCPTHLASGMGEALLHVAGMETWFAPCTPPRHPHQLEPQRTLGCIACVWICSWYQSPWSNIYTLQNYPMASLGGKIPPNYKYLQYLTLLHFGQWCWKTGHVQPSSTLQACLCEQFMDSAVVWGLLWRRWRCWREKQNKPWLNAEKVVANTSLRLFFILRQLPLSLLLRGFI